MKKIIIVSVTLFIIAPIMCLADFNISQWKYYKDIQGVKDGVVEFSLDENIFSGSGRELSDIRIVDASGKEIPFKIISGRQLPEKKSYPANLVNNSYIPGQSSMAIIDLGSRGIAINDISINTSSENFQRNVKISGSDDMQTWNILRDGAYVYDYTDRKGNFKSQNVTISFPESVFRYLKVEVSDEGGNPIKINSIYADHSVVESVREFEQKPTFSISENTTDKTTEIVADRGVSGVPTGKISFKINGDNFNRGLVIYSSKDKDKWNYIGQNYIFRYNTPKFKGENLTINFPETSERYLKISILNKDNSSLAVSNIITSSIYRDIVFVSTSGNTYRVYYGNPNARYPEYDLEKYFQYLDVEHAQVASLSVQKENNSFIAPIEPQKPLSERIPYLFSTVLVFVSLFLVVLVYQFLKSSRK